MRVAGSKAGSVSFSVTMDSQLLQRKEVPGSNYILIRGQCPGDINNTQATGPTDAPESDKGTGMHFAAVLQVEVFGGKARLEVLNNETLKVHEADWAVLYVAASSSFDGPFKNPSTLTKDPASVAFATLEKIRGLSFDEVLAAHLADYQPLFQRVSLQLGNHRCIGGDEVDEDEQAIVEDRRSQEKSKLDLLKELNQNSVDGARDLSLWEFIIPSEVMEDKTMEGESGASGSSQPAEYSLAPRKKRISTKDRVLKFKEDEDPGLVVLLFQYGRYLMIASSRPKTFASNLQGVWNNSLNPAWR